MTTRICANVECGVEFTPTTHNQKYHNKECCRVATNKRIMEDYYEKKARKQGKKRQCKTRGCDTILSRYNGYDYCHACRHERDSKVGNFFAA